MFKELMKTIKYIPRCFSDALLSIETIEENYNKIEMIANCDNKEMSRCKKLINYLGCTTLRNNYDETIDIQNRVIQELLVGNKLKDILAKINKEY